MDPDPPSSTPRKVKFRPKALAARRKPSLVLSNNAGEDELTPETQESLIRKSQELQTGQKPNPRKEPRDAFSHGSASTATETFDRQRESTEDQSERISSAASSKASPLSEMQSLANSLSDAGTEEVSEESEDLSDGVIPKKKREYQEPWDIENSYYPVTLPLRRPYSGDPELLDKAEFEEGLEYDENSLSSASELGLQEQDETKKMIFFQFPQLPLGKQATSSSTKGKEIAGSSINAARGQPSRNCCSLEELPEGHMGKMLVYKSGAVKLKIGDILYDVSSGIERGCPQSVMAINTTARQCCELGGVTKTAVVTPDINYLLENGID